MKTILLQVNGSMQTATMIVIEVNVEIVVCAHHLVYGIVKVAVQGSPKKNFLNGEEFKEAQRRAGKIRQQDVIHAEANTRRREIACVSHQEGSLMASRLQLMTRRRHMTTPLPGMSCSGSSRGRELCEQIVLWQRDGDVVSFFFLQIRGWCR